MKWDSGTATERSRAIVICQTPGVSEQIWAGKVLTQIDLQSLLILTMKVHNVSLKQYSFQKYKLFLLFTLSRECSTFRTALVCLVRILKKRNGKNDGK